VILVTHNNTIHNITSCKKLYDLIDIALQTFSIYNIVGLHCLTTLRSPIETRSFSVSILSFRRIPSYWRYLSLILTQRQPNIINTNIPFLHKSCSQYDKLSSKMVLLTTVQVKFIFDLG